MNTVSQPLPVRHMRAADAALMRWYPSASLRLIQRVRMHLPHYPLIAGGRRQGRVSA